MSRPRHRVHAAGAYFVTAETWQRRPLFRNGALAEILIEAMLDYRSRGEYRLHDFVVMPDHFHAILTPGHTTTLERAVQLIKGGSSRRIGQARNMKCPVWQPGFHEHWLRSEEDYRRCQAYINENPVKAKIVNIAAEYRYSSVCGLHVLDEFNFA
jgi:putative transposase